MDTTRNVEEFFKNVKAECKKMNNHTTDWQQVRIQAAIEMMKTLRSDKDYEIYSHIQIARISVEHADALVKALKGE